MMAYRGGADRRLVPHLFSHCLLLDFRFWGLIHSTNVDPAPCVSCSVPGTGQTC
jgi:hypothetical protein